MKFRRFLFPVFSLGVIPIVFRKLIIKKFSETNLNKTSSTQPGFDSINRYIEAQMHRLKIPGVSLTIIEGNRIVHQCGFGQAGPGSPPPTPKTPFVLGSTTKSITASAVMQLVEAGKVELDATVQHYLSWFRVADPIASAQITIRHLLNQTSGLPMIPGMANLADLDDNPDAGMRQARALSALKLSHPVGTTFEYSNLNYNLLGLVIESVSGKSYTDYIQRYIFEPLKMDHSYTSLPEAKQDGLAVGHRYWFGQPVAIKKLPLARGSLPSGQLISCSEDMAHYLIAHLNDGDYEGSKILSRMSIEEMQHAGAEQLVMGKPVTAYGMGWFINEIDGVRVIAHGGNVPEFSSYMALIPEQKKGVVMLANSDQWGFPLILMEVGDGVSALLAGKQPPPIKFGFFPWVMRSLLLVPFLQIMGILSALKRFRRWQQDPSSMPVAGRKLKQQFILRLIPNIILVAFHNYLCSTGILGYMKLYMPDTCLVIRVSGGLAGTWALLKIGLNLRFLRKPV